MYFEVIFSYFEISSVTLFRLKLYMYYFQTLYFFYFSIFHFTNIFFYFLHFCTFCISAFPLLGSLLSWGTLKYYLICYKIRYIVYSVHLKILQHMFNSYVQAFSVSTSVLYSISVRNYKTACNVYCTVYRYGIIKQPVMCTVQYIGTEL